MNFGLRPAATLTGLSLAAFAVAAFGAQACTLTVGSGPFDGGGFDFDEPDSGTLRPVTAACASCLYAQCSGIQAACNYDRSCLTIYNCAVQEGASVSGCIGAHPDGEPEYKALYSCDNRNACNSCASACFGQYPQTNCDLYPPPVVTPQPDAGEVPPTADAGPDPVVDSGPPPVPVVTCNDCLAANCAAENAACGEGSECKSYSGCISNCINSAPDKLLECIDACGQVYPTGKAQGDAQGTCTNDKCHAACIP